MLFHTTGGSSVQEDASQRLKYDPANLHVYSQIYDSPQITIVEQSSQLQTGVSASMSTKNILCIDS